MPKAVAYTLVWSAAQQTYELSGSQGGEALSFVPDSPAWFAWLAEVPSFAFHGQIGSFTARQEVVQRGEHYWYAYRRSEHKLSKKYLGKTADLTLARLEQVASMLEAERPRGEPLAPARPSQQEPRQRPATLPSDPFNPLLSTKLHVPRPPLRLVPRSRLLERLSQGLWQTLILLCAPAGFGKTTLLAEFLAERGLPVAWLSLDAEDNDPLRFLSAVLSALRTCDPSLGASARSLLSSPRDLSLPTVFALLINEIANRDTDDLLLVLDDYHLVSDPSIQQALGYLVEHCPPNLHLVLSTRADPPLALARLRARGQLCELRAVDLQFDAEEARHFLYTALGRELEASTLTTILTRTEGWIAGLQLTALSLQARRSEAEVRQFLADSLDTQRHLVDYLTEEVLAQQPEAVQTFLLHTSILEPLSASLCAAVTEASSQEESATMLAYLERANLFLFPLDERGEWYRYHPLWASVLRVRLERQLGAASVAALYGRASRWYERHDLPAEAVEAAMQANEYERAVQLLEQLSTMLLVRGQYLTVRRWIERLPPEQWRSRPILCLFYAWALFLGGQLAAYEPPLLEAERLFEREEHAIGVGLAAALRAVAAARLGEGQEAVASGRKALALLPAFAPLPPVLLASRSMSLSAVVAGHLLLGEAEAAVQMWTEARPLHEQARSMGLLLYDRLLLGQVFGQQGKLHEAAVTYQQVIEQAVLWRHFALEAMIRLAEVLYEWNACEEAEAQLVRALAEAGETAEHVMLARGVLALAYVTRARLREVRGEHEAARALFSQALRLAEQRYPHVLARAQAAQVRCWLVQGELEAGRRWREAWASTQEAAPTYEDEPEVLTEARVLIAEGEAGEALRLLEGYRTLARSQGRLGSELEILVLSALAQVRRGKTEPAVQHLQQALALAEPEGYVRLFLDEGLALAPLLRLVLSRWQGQRRAHYVQQLLTLLEAEHPQLVGSALAHHQAGHISPVASRVSARELAVLRLLAEGLTTPQMAARLVVSPNTIKTQVSSLYRKLDVRTREAAIAEAVRLHLL